jgi:hypothetical protein
MHLSPDDLPQSLVPRLSDYEIHLVAFAPAHQLVAAEAGIPAHNDFYRRPRRPKLGHDSLDFLQAAESSVVIGFPQTRAQNLFFTKNVER